MTEPPATVSDAQVAPPGPSVIGDDGDSAALVSLYQKQKKIYARSVSGLFATWRWALVWITQLVFNGLHWLSWNDRQAVLFDLGTRRFYIFGLVLYPQDFIYLTGLLIVSAYALFLFTAVAGRLWCGFACPQTVYTEIFMWIEQKIEGDRTARMKLDQGPWSLNRAWRVAAKQVVWVGFGLWTGFTFVGYFTPIHLLGSEALVAIGYGSPSAPGLGPWEWFWILFYGFATYGNAGYMREQVCKYMCPYARFQSVMFDKDTLIISYDSERGEPRGSRPRQADPAALNLGSCIDCGLCVQVCPTGIDIRQGLQYECIGCAACIDVCDGIMDKMNYPRGLIRYATENGLNQHLDKPQMWRRVFRPRVLIYSLILLLICAAFVASVALRSPFRVDVVKDRSTLARIVEDGRVENVFRLQIMNAAEERQHYRIAVSGLPGMQIVGQPEVVVEAAEALWVTVDVQLPFAAAQQAGPGAHPIEFKVLRLSAGEHGGHDEHDAPAIEISEKSTFLVPR